ncbi:unnamed protein product, partial [Brenthis ino]
MLRQKIIDDIYTLRNKELYPKVEKDVIEDYEYIDNKKKPITPIIIKSKTKSHAALRLPAIKKTTTVKFDNTTPAKMRIGNDNTSFSKTRANKRIRKVKRVRIKKPLEIFYRRGYNKDLLSQRIEWVHCMDMITPLLNGVKVNISNPKRLSPRDATVKSTVEKIKKGRWGSENLKIAIEKVIMKKMTLREAASRYGNPTTTLYDKLKLIRDGSTLRNSSSQCTGIYPFNENIFSDLDYIPSDITNIPIEEVDVEQIRVDHLPPDVPQKISEQIPTSPLLPQNLPRQPSTSKDPDFVRKTIFNISPLPDAAKKRAQTRKRKSEKSQILTSSTYKLILESKKNEKKLKEEKKRQIKQKRL